MIITNWDGFVIRNYTSVSNAAAFLFRCFSKIADTKNMTRLLCSLMNRKQRCFASSLRKRWSREKFTIQSRGNTYQLNISQMSKIFEWPFFAVQTVLCARTKEDLDLLVLRLNGCTFWSKIVWSLTLSIENDTPFVFLLNQLINWTKCRAS